MAGIVDQRSLHREALLRVIRSVKNRWRLRMALRGAAIVLAAGLVAFLVSAYGMDSFRFSPEAVIAFRILAYSVPVLLAIRFLLLPLLRRVPDERVALYLEEHERSLDAHIVSAVEFSSERMAHGQAERSAAFSRHLVESALARCAEINQGRRVEHRALARSSTFLAGATLFALLVLLLAPPFVRHSAPFLLFPWGDARAENPYSIHVTPGDAALAQGADLRVAARLINFDADRVDIAVKRGESGDWERWPMALDDESAEYLFFVFDLDESTEYFVEASGVRSSIFRVEVVELPYVDQIDLEYRFPAYTGLSPRTQEDGGDIAALRGTKVVLRVTPTVPVEAGLIQIEGGDSIPLSLEEDGSLSGSLEIEGEGFYRIALRSPRGDWVVASPDYVIDVLIDQPPAVSFAKPGRDIKATRIEEVFTEVEAEDDYGLRSVELRYSVSGGPEQTIRLYGGRGLRKQLSAGHTFFLEEIELEPGDFISYYARAIDNNRISGPHVATTDIYFVEVRPFDREFRQADQSGMGAAGPAGLNEALSRRQREIVAATFKMVRDRDQYSEKEYQENLATLALAQGRLREQVETLAGRISSRGIAEMDSSFKVIAEALPRAAREMLAAEELLGRREPQEALSPEQRALQHLQRAEATFREVQISRGAPGGSGTQPNAEDLADLFELEMDQLRNQYERLQRGRRQELDNQIDEVMQKLQELARRQQAENERMRARAANPQGQPGGGGQRQLAAEAEQLARRLERLAREESLPELSRTARRLQEAADAMRRAAAGSRGDGLSEGIAALDQLRDARRLVERNRAARLKRDTRDALDRAERLAEEERRVISGVEQLAEGADQGEQISRIIERKEGMAAEVADLEAQLDRMARESRREQKEASRLLQEAAGSIRDKRLKEMIRYSRGVVQGRSPEYARNFESQIQSNIGGLRDKIEEALGAIGETEEQRIARSLDRTRQLVEALESIDERIRERNAAADSRRRQPGGRQSGETTEGQSDQRAAPGEEPDGQVSPGGPSGPVGFTPDEIRQLSREFRERGRQMEQLRQGLRREDIDVGELAEIIRLLRELDDRRVYGDPRALEELSAGVLQGLKEFEYALRRQLEGSASRALLLSGSDEVPPGFRELVEEYYRSLAER